MAMLLVPWLVALTTFGCSPPGDGEGTDFSRARESMVTTQIAARGVRDPKVLASLRHKGIKAPEAKIIASLEGRWDEEQLFVLRQVTHGAKHATKQLGRICRSPTGMPEASWRA